MSLSQVGPKVLRPRGKGHRVARSSREPSKVGDKVRLKSGPSAGIRGVLSAISGQSLKVLVADGTRIDCSASEVVNYSAAARLAWRTMPKRAGRPTSPDRKIRVSVRIDEAIWRDLGAHVDSGRIRSREHLLNTLLRQATRYLNRSRDRMSPSQTVVLSLRRSRKMENQ